MICLFDALLCHAFDWVEGSGQHNPQSSSLPHVDQVLGQGDGLCVAGDADGPVKVGRRVSVFAVRDPDHRARELSGYFYIYFIFLLYLYLYIHRARELSEYQELNIWATLGH